MTHALSATVAPGIASKIALASDHAPSQPEVEVATCLHELEHNNECDIQRDVALLKIAGVLELDVNGDSSQKVVVIGFPYRLYVDVVRRIQTRLIGELEKKLGKFVVLHARRRIMSSKTIRSSGLRALPRSRTLTAVQNALLEDIVKPAEIVGKRIRVRLDGTHLHKIYLDPKDRDIVESKLAAFAEVYKKLTTRVAVFSLKTF